MGEIQREILAPWIDGKNGKYRNLFSQGNYDPTEYERACHTVDVAICRLHQSQLQVLLIKRKYDPYADKWAIPGGFVDVVHQEGLEEAAYRELQEETGVTGIPIRELATFGSPNRDPRWRTISTVYYALVSETIIDKTKIEASSDAKEYAWFDFESLPDLAFDHGQILQVLFGRIRVAAVHKPLAMELLPPLFTWSELQKAYEILLGRKLVASNFRRDISYDYIVEETGVKQESIPGRKGRLGVLCRYKGERIRFG